MKVYEVPLRLEPQPEDGFTVTSPVLQGLLTEGGTVAEALAHAAEVLDLVLEDYGAEGKPLPEWLRQEVRVHTRRGSRRASLTSPSGACTCSHACSSRLMSRPTPRCLRRARSCAAIRRRGRQKPGAPPPRPRDYASIVVPFELETDAGTLAFFSTTTVFGTPVDVTLSELALELFFPANAATVEALRHLAG